MPVISILRSCRPKLKCLVVLIALAVAAASLLVLVFQPLPVNVHHLLAWENCPNDSGQQAVGVALSLKSADDAGTTRAATDLGTSTTTTNYRNTSGVLSTSNWGNSRAVCVGSNASLGEVEDLLCLPKPNYDESMKNPCWWDNTTPTPGVQVPLQPVRSLSCLPYFHILCCSKSGTTDMYRRISMHPDIVPNYGIFGKERLYWGWSKYGYSTRYNKGTPVPFYKYIKGFGILARYLEKAAVENPKDLKRLVTLDGSPPDMWEFRGWTQLPQNRNLRNPAVLTPHLMRHLYRDPKFLILVREPVERLYTVYLFLGLGHSAEDFHRDAVKGIDMFDRCLAQVQDRIECFVNASFIDSMPASLGCGSFHK